MADNKVTFDLELAVKDFNSSLRSVDKNINNFHNDFKKRAKTSSIAWGSFVGNLGAAAVSSAIAGLASLTSSLADFTKEAVLAAVDAEETLSKFEAVFSGISEAADKTAKDLSRSFGLGRVEAKTLLSATGDLLTGFGFTQEGALDLSKQVQELSVDLASFTNFSGGAKGASEAITKALLGEREAIKQLGVSVQEKDVQEQVSLNTAKGLVFETERQAKAHATLQLIVKQSGNAIGDYAKTSGSAANQIKKFNTNIEDLTIMFGENFIPVIQPVTTEINKFIESLDQKIINDFTQAGLMFLIEQFITLSTVMPTTIAMFNKLQGVVTIAMNAASIAVSGLGAIITAFASDFLQTINTMLEALPDSLVPDGWIEGIDEAIRGFDENVKNFADQVKIDAEDIKVAFNGMFDEESVFSDEAVLTITDRLEMLKQSVIKNRDELDDDQLARDKAEIKRLKKLEEAEKKATQKAQKETKKDSDFKEAMFGKQTTWEESGGKERAANLKSTLSTMATLSESGSKTLAGIGKAAAISTATIDGIAAVQKALASAPPPLNYALAGAVGIASAANVQKIASVKMQHGGIVPGSSFAGDSVQANLNSGEMVLNRGQQATLFQQANGGGAGNNGDLIAAISALGDRISSMEVVVMADDTEIARSASRGVQNGIIIGESR